MKDERLPVSSVAEGKVRLFGNGSMDLDHVVRKYFLSFVAHVMATHEVSDVAVGVNVFSESWSNIISRLSRLDNPCWIAGDYSGFDRSVPYRVAMGVCDIVNSFYNDQFSRIRQNIVSSLFSTYHLCDGYLYRVYQGMPTGTPLTAVFNSLCNALMLRIAFFASLEEQGIESKNWIPMFRANVRMTIYGDDHVVAVSKNVSYFNQKFLVQYFAQYGMQYTSASKNEISEQFTPLQDVTFLKRKFVYQHGRWWAPLPEENICEMLMWYRKSYYTNGTNVLEQLLLSAAQEYTQYPGKNKRFEAWDKMVFRVRGILSQHSCLIAIPPAMHDYKLSDVIAVRESTVYYTYEDLEPIQIWETEKATPMKITMNQNETQINSQIAKDCNTTQACSRSRSIAKRNKRTGNCMLKLEAGNEQLAEAAQEDTVLAASQGIQKVGLTTFYDQAAYASVSSGAFSLTHDRAIVSDNLVNFVQRPFVLETFDLPVATDANGRPLKRYYFPLEFFASDKTRGYFKNKFANVAFYKAGLKIMVRVNATKFHYGKLMAAWRPNSLYGTDSIGWDTEKPNEISIREAGPWTNVFTASQGVNTLISITGGTVATLDIKYPLPYQYIPMCELLSPKYNLGSLDLYILTPIGPSDGSPVSVVVQASFTDVEFFGFTPSSVIKEGKGYPSKVTYLDYQSWNDPIDMDITKVSGVSTTMDALALQFQAGEENQLQNPRRPTGSVIKTIDTCIAAVGKVGTAARSIAQAIGLSSPVEVKPPTSMLIRPHDTATTVSVNPAMSLAFHPSSEISLDPAMLNYDAKDFLFKNLAERWSLLGLYKDVATDASSALFRMEVSPWLVPTITTSLEAKIVKFPTLPFAICDRFEMWRGRVEYKFCFVCSSFVSARYRVDWDPVYGAAKSIEIGEYGVNKVVDVNGDTEMTFEVPYMAANQWRNRPSDKMTNFANGELLLTRLTDIVDRDKSISLPVYILVYMRVIDLQVAYPYGSRKANTLELQDVYLWPPARPSLMGPSVASPDNPQSDDPNAYSDLPVSGFDSQQVIEEPKKVEEQPGPISFWRRMQLESGVDILPTNSDLVQRDTGNEAAPALALTDSPASLLHLIKRPYLSALAMTSDTNDVRFDMNMFAPDTVLIDMSAAVPGQIEKKTCTRITHPLDYFTCMFKFRRGSINVIATSSSVQKRQNRTQPARIWIFNQPACDNTDAVTRFSTPAITGSTALMVGSGMGWGDNFRPLHFNIPYLSNHVALPFPRFLDVYNNLSGQYEIEQDTNFMFNKEYFGEVPFTPSIVLFGDGPSSIWYSAGDDFLPLLFYGFPAVFYENILASPVT
nr:polyprotein [signal crayfish associated picorna-like virus 1]